MNPQRKAQTQNDLQTLIDEDFQVSSIRISATFELLLIIAGLIATGLAFLRHTLRRRHA